MGLAEPYIMAYNNASIECVGTDNSSDNSTTCNSTSDQALIPQDQYLKKLVLDVWALSLVCLILRVNWSLFVDKYNAWQDQHSSFRLQSGGKLRDGNVNGVQATSYGKMTTLSVNNGERTIKFRETMSGGPPIATLKLANVELHPAVFIVRAAASEHYRVYPESGVLKAGESVDVQLEMLCDDGLVDRRINVWSTEAKHEASSGNVPMESIQQATLNVVLEQLRHDEVAREDDILLDENV